MLQRIEHPQGADRDYDFAVTDALDQPENITGWTFAFTLWAELAETPVRALQLLSASGGIVVDVVAQGIGRVLVRAVDLQALPPGRYRMILECTRTDATTDRLLDGIFILVPAKPSA